MQLHLDRDDLQLLCEVLEGRDFELRRQARERPGDASLQRQLAELEAVLEGAITRRLQFGCDELDLLSDLLDDVCRRARSLAQDDQEKDRCRRLERIRERIAEVSAMM